MDKMKFQYEDNKHLYLLIYDISNDSKRTKLSKLLDGYGLRVQKSAYEIKLSKQQRVVLKNKIGQFMASGDSVRMYVLGDLDSTEIWGENRESFEDFDVLIV